MFNHLQLCMQTAGVSLIQACQSRLVKQMKGNFPNAKISRESPKKGNHGLNCPHLRKVQELPSPTQTPGTMPGFSLTNVVIRSSKSKGMLLPPSGFRIPSPVPPVRTKSSPKNQDLLPQAQMVYERKDT